MSRADKGSGVNMAPGPARGQNNNPHPTTKPTKSPTSPDQPTTSRKKRVQKKDKAISFIFHPTVILGAQIGLTILAIYCVVKSLKAWVNLISSPLWSEFAIQRGEIVDSIDRKLTLGAVVDYFVPQWKFSSTLVEFQHANRLTSLITIITNTIRSVLISIIGFVIGTIANVIDLPPLFILGQFLAFITTTAAILVSAARVFYSQAVREHTTGVKPSHLRKNLATLTRTIKTKVNAALAQQHNLLKSQKGGSQYGGSGDTPDSTIQHLLKQYLKTRNHSGLLPPGLEDLLIDPATTTSRNGSTMQHVFPYAGPSGHGAQFGGRDQGPNNDQDQPTINTTALVRISSDLQDYQQIDEDGRGVRNNVSFHDRGNGHNNNNNRDDDGRDDGRDGADGENLHLSPIFDHNNHPNAPNPNHNRKMTPSSKRRGMYNDGYGHHRGQSGQYQQGGNHDHQYQQQGHFDPIGQMDDDFIIYDNHIDTSDSQSEWSYESEGEMDQNMVQNDQNDQNLSQNENDQNEQDVLVSPSQQQTPNSQTPTPTNLSPINNHHHPMAGRKHQPMQTTALIILREG